MSMDIKELNLANEGLRETNKQLEELSKVEWVLPSSSAACRCSIERQGQPTDRCDAKLCCTANWGSSFARICRKKRSMAGRFTERMSGSGPSSARSCQTRTCQEHINTQTG